MSVFKRKLGDLKRKLGVNGVEDPESIVSRAPLLKKPYKPFTLSSRINPSPSTQSSKHPKSSGQPETGPATGVPPTSCDMSAIGVKPTQKGAETGVDSAGLPESSLIPKRKNATERAKDSSDDKPTRPTSD